MNYIIISCDPSHFEDKNCFVITKVENDRMQVLLKTNHWDKNWNSIQSFLRENLNYRNWLWVFNIESQYIDENTWEGSVKKLVEAREKQVEISKEFFRKYEIQNVNFKIEPICWKMFLIKDWFKIDDYLTIKSMLKKHFERDENNEVINIWKKYLQKEMQYSFKSWNADEIDAFCINIFTARFLKRKTFVQKKWRIDLLKNEIVKTELEKNEKRKSI